MLAGGCVMNKSSDSTAQKPKLLDQVKQAIRTKHYSHRTDSAPLHKDAMETEWGGLCSMDQTIHFLSQ